MGLGYIMSEKYSFRNFTVVWLGQFLSVLGSAISGFGLSVWLFEQTNSATPFAISFLCSILPSLLFSPLAGSLADRKNRKKIIMLTDSFDALLKLIMALLLLTRNLQVWMVYPFMIISSTLGTFQSPAFSSSVPMLVHEKDLSRANGMRQLSGAAQNMLAPIFAGALYAFLRVEGLLIVDLCSYLFAFITIAIIPIPQPTIKSTNYESKKLISTALKDFREAFSYLRKLSKLYQSILIFMVVNFIANMAMILISPMILATYDTTIYGISQTVSGIAMILGALIASILPDPKNKYATMYGVLTVSGIGLIVGGLSPHWLYIFIGIFAFCLFIPYVNSLSQTIIQTTVEKSMLGRMDSTVTVLCQLAMPVSALLSGWLADNLLGPMMIEGGILAETFIGKIIGVGPSRECGLIFVLGGIILFILCTVCLIGSLKSNPYIIKKNNARHN